MVRCQAIQFNEKKKVADLRQDVIHRLTSLLVALSKQAEQSQDFHLQERIRNS